MRRVPLLFFVALVFVPDAAWSQGTPIDPEFRVNTYTTGHQGTPPFLGADPCVTSDASGNFVVVWPSDGQDGSGLGIFGQRYDSSGAPLGGEFRVNTYTTNSQGNLGLSVAADASGNFVVVWSSQGQDGSGLGIFGQRYASSGAPLGGEFRVNTYTTSTQEFPSVASDAAGNFIVVWDSYGQTGSAFDVFGQRFASSGTPLGPEFRVNTYTNPSPTDWQITPSVAADSSGNFVVVWRSDYQLSPPGGFGLDVFGQRYHSSGAPLGPEFQVNTLTPSIQDQPSVAADPSGNFVVVWESYYPDGSSFGVFGQRYAASGTPLGPEFRVNTYTTNGQGSPSVAADSSGNFVVAWSGTGAGDPGAVFGQRYASTGAPLGPEFRVNTYTTLGQHVLKLLAMLTDPASIARHLAAVGEATEVPRRSENHGPPYWKSRVLLRQPLGHEDGSHSGRVDEAP